MRFTLIPGVLMLLMVTIVAPLQAQNVSDLADLRDRLVESRNDDYIAARDAALGLSQEQFNDFLDLLRESPEYSLEQILALILEARANHPKEAAHFDRDRQHCLDNPDIGRHGGPIYRPWTSREPKELHPLVYEAMIKFDRSGPVSGMVLMPNPDNIPFILYFAKHVSPGALSWLTTATRGYPEERAWLRPLAVQIYKEYRQSGEISSAPAVIAMFHRFETRQDLEILK